MAKKTVNIGAIANDNTGDPVRAAFGKLNDNFTEIYTTLGGTISFTNQALLVGGPSDTITSSTGLTYNGSTLTLLGDITLTGNISVGGTVDGRDIAVDGAKLDGLSPTANVAKVGVPVNDQVGVWTGDGTIEGATNLTWNGLILTVTGDLAITGTVDGRDIAADGAIIDGLGTISTQDSTAINVTGGTIDGTVIGGVTPAAGTFTSIGATGGTIDGTVIGGVTPAAGTFTSIGATGGTIDGTVIGGVTPAAGTFTSIRGESPEAVIASSLAAADSLIALSSTSNVTLLAGDDVQPGVTWTPSIETEFLLSRGNLGTVNMTLLSNSIGNGSINFADTDLETSGQILYNHTADTMGLQANNSIIVTIGANGLAVGTTAPTVSLDLQGTDAVQLTSGTTAQRPVGAAGMLRYNSEIGTFEGYTTTWGAISGDYPTGAGGDKIFWENDQTITTDYTITSGKNAMSAGPITISTGVTVTVGAGDTWTIV